MRVVFVFGRNDAYDYLFKILFLYFYVFVQVFLFMCVCVYVYTMFFILTDFQFSGSYKGDGGDSDSLELRIDWDSISEYAKSLHVVSGDIFAAGKWQMSFFVNNPRVELPDDKSAKITGEGKIWDSKTRVSIEVTITKDNGDGINARAYLKADDKEKSFTCSRYSRFYRTVEVEIDFTSEKLYLPKYNTHLHPSRPPFLPQRDIDLFSAYADAGIELKLDSEECTLVTDPDPNTAWTNAELYEIQNRELEGEDPNKWKIWGIITEKYALGSSIVAAMFDTKTRKGFGVFTEAGLLSGLPPMFPEQNQILSLKEKIALRHYLFAAVHECGHVFNLQHCFSLGRPDSLTWMNYASIYNRTNGSDAFFRSFEFKFDDVELMWLRHGPYNKVKPGEGNWGKLSPCIIPAVLDPDDPRCWAKLLSFDVRLAKTEYTQMEPITLECRLRVTETCTHSVFVETGFAPKYDLVKIYVTQPSGEIELVNSFEAQDSFDSSMELFPPGSLDGPDRHSELVMLLYEADGFLFKEPGTYKIVAVYKSNDKELISSKISFDVVPYQGEQETLTRFFQDDVGFYIALGGNRSAKYDQARNFLESLANNPQDASWAGALVAETFSAYAKSFKLIKSSKKDGKVDVEKLAQPDYAKLVEATENAVKFYKAKGTKGDNLLYSRIIIQRAKLLLAAGKKDKARAEVEEAIGVMQTRGLKAFVAEKINEIWLNMCGEASPKLFDAKAMSNDIFFYEDKNFDPDDTAYGDRHREFTLTLGEVFSQFNEKHLAASTLIVNDMFNMADETEDLKSVIDYVYKLQHGRMYNQEMIKYAFALFVIHHPLAREAGLRYPENTTPAKPSPFLETRPTGPPDESWMNYWRNDSEFVYHHDHWHRVYVGQSLPSSVGTHLDRQGELFGYMHQQMLARYNAERQAQGLPVVVAYEFDEVEPDGCDLRPIFVHPSFAPRPAGMKWSDNNIQQFRQWDYALNNVIQTGQIRGPNMETINLRGPQTDTAYFGPNYFGHIVEATTNTFYRYYGSLHNMGHGVFGSIGQPPRRSSYMNSTATAVRDPIFFRWHKRVDTYIENFSNTLETDLATDAPAVRIAAGDVIITSSPTPPENFSNFSGSNWVVNSFASDNVYTELGPARFDGEFGKLTHQPYSYHIRVARTNLSDISNPLYLTVRIFICPANAAADRRRWIEMDKFRYILPSNQPADVISRQDKHSSVIRRFPEDMQGDIEGNTTYTVSGFCECGWPYNLLFPCGTASGEPYKICVFISDNNVDQQGIRTRCGSLSYCGAQGQRYPDQRQMGYPFATPMLVNGQPVSVQQASNQLWNMAVADFSIVNRDVRYGSPTTMVTPQYDRIAWYSQDQLNITRQSPYVASQWTGVFRVLISGAVTEGSGSNFVVRFEGRGFGNGSYSIANASIAKRLPRTLSITGEAKIINFEGGQEATMVIPEGGAQSLPIEMPFEEDDDYFVTFQVLQPSCFLRNPTSTGQTLYSPHGGQDLALLPNWDNANEQTLSNIYAVSKIVLSH